MVVEFILRGLKTKIDTDTIISLLKAGNDIKNEYIIGVIQELVAKCKALEPLNVSILDLLSIVDKQTKDIDRLEAEIKQLKEENASIKNDKSELILAIENTRHDIKMTADYLDSIVNAFHGNNKFDWEKFKSGDIAVHCSTIKEAKDFIKSAKDHLEIWYGGDKIDEEYTYWETHEREMCYAYKNTGLIISSRETSHNCGREILEWSDYMVKYDE